MTALQAAFRTSTGSSRSASRYSTRNGESIGPSPGLPRGGGIAERCAGVLPKYISAGVAPPETLMRAEMRVVEEADLDLHHQIFGHERPYQT